MKIILLVSGLVFGLNACSTPPVYPITIAPQPTISSAPVAQNKSVMVDSRDLRTAQFVAFVDNGRENVQPIHATSNILDVLEDVLIRQLNSQGFYVNTDGIGKLRLDLLDALVKVKNSVFSHEMTTNVQIQLVAETKNNKLVKRYTGRSTIEGTMNASVEDIGVALNSLLEVVLKDIARDEQMITFLNENF
ncbi:YajG family lipoprotein [Candidatus Enterovibrio escicola]|uniref:YajG family lipoprotein n=1 Tax=Candidatus Enterovibrio escicola TaxID=1927127 RepID=UPI0012382DF1|nr:YajG family lipoprotein [Candidatus Enterovibrio escacola]